MTRRFTAAAIRRQVPSRSRLSVPIEMDVVFDCQGEYHTARMLNLSCESVFLASDILRCVGSRLTLHLANVGRGDEALSSIVGEVDWRAERGIPEAGLPRGMSIHFIDLAEPARKRLDDFVVETLEKLLLVLDADSLDPDFIRRELLSL